MLRRLTWISVGLLVITAIATFCVWLPAPLKKLGLFSCLFGGIIGFVLWKLKEIIIHERHAGEKWITFLLGGLAEGMRISESYRVSLTEQQRSLAQQMQKLQGMMPALEEELTRHLSQSFTEFLALRYSAISSGLEQTIGPWGLIFLFVIEILLCAASCCFVFRYFSTHKSTEKKSD